MRIPLEGEVYTRVPKPFSHDAGMHPRLKEHRRVSMPEIINAHGGRNATFR